MRHVTASALEIATGWRHGSGRCRHRPWRARIRHRLGLRPARSRDLPVLYRPADRAGQPGTSLAQALSPAARRTGESSSTGEQAGGSSPSSCPLVAFVALSVTLGMYVATTLYLFSAMRFQGRYGWFATCGAGASAPPSPSISCSRNLFQVPPAQRPDRSRCSALLTRAELRNRVNRLMDNFASPDARLPRRAHHAPHPADDGGRAARHPRRRAAGAGRAQRRLAPAAADLQHGPGLGHHPADLASIGARCSAARPPRSCSTSQASPPPSRRHSTAIRWREAGQGDARR